jgi:hypothetical protein
MRDLCFQNLNTRDLNNVCTNQKVRCLPPGKHNISITTPVFSKVLRGRLGGVVVSVHSTGAKGRGFKPGRGDGFLRAIKICSTLPSVGK